jgi:hypothetical protein
MHDRFGSTCRPTPEKRTRNQAPQILKEPAVHEAVIRALSPWNKGKLVGPKAPFKLKEIWAIRARHQIYSRTRELVLFDLGVDSRGARYRTAKEDLQTSAVRGSQSQRDPPWPIGSSWPACTRRPPLSKSDPCFASFEHTAICPDSCLRGRGNRPRSCGVWYALNTSYEGDLDLSAHQEPARDPTLVGPHQT